MRMHGPGLLVFTIVCLAGAVPARAQPAARQAIEAANSRFSEALAARPAATSSRGRRPSRNSGRA